MSARENPASARLDLDDTRWIVTGGSSGIGKAITEALLAQGAHVVSPVRTTNALADGVLGVPCDLSLPSDRNDIIQRCVSALGDREGNVVDGLINCAGVMNSDAIVRVKESQARLVFEVNFFAALDLCQQIIPLLLANEGENKGAIVNVASNLGLRAVANRGVYAASKAAVISMTQALAMELAPDVRVNALAPGLVDTEMVAGRDPDILAGLAPLKRIGTPKELAAAALHLCQSPWTTGSVLTVDGGLLL